MTATLTYRGSATNVHGSGADSAPDFGSVSLGDAASDRWVLVMLGGRESGYTGVSVGGTALAYVAGVGEQQPVSLWKGLVPTGASATVTATATNGQSSAMLGCWTVTGGGSSALTLRDADGGEAGGVATTYGPIALTTEAGDWVFAAANGLNAGSNGRVTWSNATERSDFDFGVESMSAADLTADGSSETVQATHAEGMTEPAALAASLYLEFVPPVPPSPRRTFEVRTFTAGAQDKVIQGARIEFTDEFGTAGYVKVSLPAMSAGAAIVAKRQEVAVFKDGVELDNSRAILVEHTGNPGSADDAPGKSDTRVWGGKTFLGRLVKGIVYPENWPSLDPTYHSFDSGTTPGTIMKTFLNRAQARGALSTITHSTWSGTLDSNGNAWSQTVGVLHYEAGVTLQAVLENLIRLGVVEARMVGRDLRLYNAETLGTDRTTGSDPLIVRRGRDLTDAPYSESTDELQNALLVIGDEATIFERTDAASITEYGREEASLQQGGTKDTGTLTVLADASLARYSGERGEYTAKFSSSAPDGAEPWEDFFTGDWIYLDREGTNEKYRVRQLSLTTTEDEYEVTSTLNDKFAELDILMAKKVEGIIGGASADTVQPAEPPPPEIPEDTTTPKAPTGVGASSDAYLDDQGNPQAAVTVSWTPPTENTDNSALEDLAGHRVFIRDDDVAAPWMSIADVGADVTSAHWSPVQVGVYRRFTVEAYDSSGHTSAKATEARVLMDDDTTPPDAPSTPVLEDQLGTVVLKWDGLDAQGDAMPIDFDTARVYRSQTSGFTPPAEGTLVGYMLAAGSFVPPEQAYGATWYYRLVAYDKSGNVSGPSAQASIAVTKVGTADLVDQIVTDIAAGVAASTQVTTLLSGSPIYTKDTANGSGKWLRTRYNVATVASTIPTLDLIDGKPVIDRVLVSDSLDLAENLGDYYVGHLRTLVEKTTQGTVAWNMAHDDGASVYLDGQLVYANGSVQTSANVSFTMPAGLHLLDILWAEQTGGDGIFDLSVTVGSLVQDLDAPLSGDVAPLRVASAQATASQALTLVSGKNTLWYQTTAPTGTDHAVDDLWFDTDDGYKPYRWDGDSWEPVPWGSSALADGSVVLGKLAAGSVSTAALQAGAATFEKVALGDLSNFCEVNESYELGTLGAHGHQIEAISNVRWSRRDDNSGTEFYLRNKKGPIPFEVGDRLRVRLTAFSDTATDAGVWLHTFLADGTYITSQQIGATFNIATTAQEFAVEGDVAAATMANAAQFIIGLAGLTANRNVRLRGARAWEMNAGELLVDGSVRAEHVEANSIGTPHLIAGAVDATKLAALLILVGKIASAQVGRRWEADQHGIRLYETDGSLLINLPTDSAVPATFKGDVIANSLTVVDRFLLRGLVNSVATNAALTLAAGTTAPTPQPIVDVAYDAEASAPPYANYSVYDPYRHGWFRSGDYYYTCMRNTSDGLHIRRYTASTGLLDTGWDIAVGDSNMQVGDGGVVVVSGNVFVLGRTISEQDYEIRSYQISGGSFNWYHVCDFGPSTAYWPALGTDGTYLYTAFHDTTGDDDIHIQQRDVSDGHTLSTVSPGIAVSDNVTALIFTSADYGSARCIVAFENREYSPLNPNSPVVMDRSTWGINTNEDWPLYGMTHGMCWDSALSKFVRLDGNANQITRYTGLTWTTESDQWWASATWYDSNGTGGYHETDQSARTSFTMRKRARLVLTSPPIPPRPSPTTDDDVMRPRFYLGRGATDPTRTGMWLQTEVSDGVIVLAPASVTFSGTNPPVSNGFTDANPAKLQAADPNKFLVKGDGSGNWGSLTVSSTGVTTLGTHVLKSNGVDTGSCTADVWTEVDWTASTLINQDSWTLSSDGVDWTCPIAGTYAIFCLLDADAASAQGKIELWAESPDGSHYTIGHFDGHDYAVAQFPAVRMSVGSRTYVQIKPSGTAITLTDDSRMIITRLG